MSIDATVRDVIVKEGGAGWLMLADRSPTRAGDSGGIAGQTLLRFASSPSGVKLLIGRQIWGGDGEIMMGDTKIADRIGYTNIKFVVTEIT